MNIEAVDVLLKKLYQGTIGTVISTRERGQKKLKERSLVYGEAPLSSFKAIVDQISPQGGVFCDLGSGLGKQVLSAALLYPFDKVIGIEILDSLYSQSKEKLELLKQEVKEPLCPIEFRHSDFFKEDISDVDVLYSCSTCFSLSMMDEIAKKVEGMKKGAKIIVLTKELFSSQLKTIHVANYEMSWGPSQVFIYERI